VTHRSERNLEPFLAAYRDDPRSFGGRYVSTDLMADVMLDVRPEYGASSSSRTGNRAVVQNTAEALAGEQFRRLVQDEEQSTREVLFLTGTLSDDVTRGVRLVGVDRDVRALYHGPLAGTQGLSKIALAIEYRCIITLVAIDRGANSSVAMNAGAKTDLDATLEAIHHRFGCAALIRRVDARGPQLKTRPNLPEHPPRAADRWIQKYVSSANQTINAAGGTKASVEADSN
jgi:hypothetical protein